MEGAEYPKALYRDGGALLIWGAPVRTMIVADAEEEATAVQSGWRLHPIAQETNDVPVKRGPGRPRKVSDDGTA